VLIEPQLADAVALRGLRELRNSDITVAQQAFAKAIRVEPSASAAYIALAAIGERNSLLAPQCVAPRFTISQQVFPRG